MAWVQAQPRFQGSRWWSFDVAVVGINGTNPISYNRATGSCTLSCHNHAHGTGTGAAALQKTVQPMK